MFNDGTTLPAHPFDLKLDRWPFIIYDLDMVGRYRFSGEIFLIGADNFA